MLSKRRLWSILCLSCLMAVPAAAEKAKNYKDAVNMHLKNYLKQKKVGVAAAVVKIEKNGAIKDVHVRDFSANKGKSKPARLHLASLSKHFTGAAIARLESLKKLKASDYVRQYVRDWPKYAKNVKIKHLLQHSSGLREYTKGIKCALYDTPKKVVNWLNKRSQEKDGLKYAPGKRGYDYTNTNYVVLARIVENVSKTSFPSYMAKHFFAPLGMKGTAIKEYKPLRLKNTLHTYKKNGKSKFAVTTCDFMAGDGGVYSHVKDLRKWSKFLAGKSSKYGTKLNRYLYERDNNGYSHGLKMGSDKKVCGRHARLHGGSWSGARTQMIYVPEANVFAFVLCDGEKCGKKIGTATRELLKLYFKYKKTNGKSCE